jgi:plastocyanin
MTGRSPRVAIMLVSALITGGLLGGCRSGTAQVTFSGKVNNRGTVDVPVVTGRPALLEMEMDDISFRPTIVKVQVGTSLGLRMHNTGTVDHTFTIPALKVDTVVAAGATHDLTLRDFGTGQIPFRCRFHVGRGMQGGFLVLAG